MCIRHLHWTLNDVIPARLHFRLTPLGPCFGQRLSHFCQHPKLAQHDVTDFCIDRDCHHRGHLRDCVPAVPEARPSRQRRGCVLRPRFDHHRHLLLSAAQCCRQRLWLTQSSMGSRHAECHGLHGCVCVSASLGIGPGPGPDLTNTNTGITITTTSRLFSLVHHF